MLTFWSRIHDAQPVTSSSLGSRVVCRDRSGDSNDASFTIPCLQCSRFRDLVDSLKMDISQMKSLVDVAPLRASAFPYTHWLLGGFGESEWR